MKKNKQFTGLTEQDIEKLNAYLSDKKEIKKKKIEVGKYRAKTRQTAPITECEKCGKDIKIDLYHSFALIFTCKDCQKP
jgi:hypothetical protein